MKILNIDTLEFGIDVINYDNKFSCFLEKMSELKEKSQEKYKEQILKINKINFVVKPKGMGFYSYRLECEDFYIYFMKKDIKNNSPIFVKFLSQILWKYGVDNAYKKFIDWFQTFECEVRGTRISRLDICFDTDEIDFVPQDKEKFVTRAKKVDLQFPDSEHYIGKQFAGFVIGRGSALSCRIYNKSLEIISSSKMWFQEIWKEYNWDENNDVWRVEFQIRREVLKELNAFSVENTFFKLQEIWAYLTQKWLLMKKRINKNVSRDKLIEKWEIVQKGSCNYKPTPEIRKSIKNGNLEKLYMQCSGIMVSIAALVGTEKMSDTYLRLAEFTRENNKKKSTTFEKEVKKRKNRYIH